MCWRPLQIFSRKSSGLSCEIASDLCPNPFSHDWHVQPSCQRPKCDPPERRISVQPGPHLVRIRLSSKPFKHIVRAKPCQRMHPTEFPRDFHSENHVRVADRTGNRAPAFGLPSPFQSTRRYASSALKLKRLAANAIFRPCEGGRQKIEKRTYFWRSLP